MAEILFFPFVDTSKSLCLTMTMVEFWAYIYLTKKSYLFTLQTPKLDWKNWKEGGNFFSASVSLCSILSALRISFARTQFFYPSKLKQKNRFSIFRYLKLLQKFFLRMWMCVCVSAFLPFCHSCIKMPGRNCFIFNGSRDRPYIRNHTGSHLHLDVN